MKKEITDYTVAVDLKSVMQSKGILRTPDVNQMYYNGASEVHFLIADMSDGTYSCIIKTTSGVDFDFHDTSDQAYVRALTTREVYLLIGLYPGVSFLDYTMQGNKYRYTITHNGINYTGEDSNQANAMALAFIAVLNA